MEENNKDRVVKSMAHATRPDLGLDDDNVSITSNREEFYDQGIDRFD